MSILYRPLSGSSPLTRGTLDQFRRPCHYLRFIPAYAGNSVCSGIEAASVAVHPRLRGELMLSLDSRSNRPGSSPLTRGTHVLENGLRKFARFIPAYAGNSSLHFRASPVSPVHPRFRGELQIKDLNPNCFTGSSPLTRGTPRQCPRLFRRRRFIPAYAGNSLSVQLTTRA